MIAQQRTIRPCGCSYQRKKDWGYHLWKRVPGSPWEALGGGSLEAVNNALKNRAFKALVKCQGCGAEMLRDY